MGLKFFLSGRQILKAGEPVLTGLVAVFGQTFQLRNATSQWYQRSQRFFLRNTGWYLTKNFIWGKISMQVIPAIAWGRTATSLYSCGWWRFWLEYFLWEMLRVNDTSAPGAFHPCNSVYYLTKNFIWGENFMSSNTGYCLEGKRYEPVLTGFPAFLKESFFVWNATSQWWCGCQRFLYCNSVYCMA